MAKEEVGIGFINGRFLHRGKEYDSYAKEEIVTPPHQFEGPVARVGRGYGLTLNLTNYESARFDVYLEVPCHVEDIDNADKFAKDWAMKRCEEEVADVRGPKKPKPEKLNPKKLSNAKSNFTKNKPEY